MSTETVDDRAADLTDAVARVRASGVELLYLQCITLSGRTMAKVLPARHVERALERGVQFHDSVLCDLTTDRRGRLIGSGPHTGEITAIPDPATFCVLPWDRSVGRLLCTLHRRQDDPVAPGAPLPACVRSRLKRAHAEFTSGTGLELRSGCEPEMSWFGEGLAVPTPDHVAPNYQQAALETMRPIVKRVIAYAEAMGLDMVEGDYEDHGQLELNFRFDRCDVTADRLVTYRQVCAQVAREFGVTATFMPKPTVGAMANGCHHNLSLWSGDRNVLVDDGDRTLHVSEIGRAAIGGLLTHARGMTALMAPTVNSYARYWDVGQFAPTLANWGFDNRTCAVRVSASDRLEFKLPDASVNPYLSHLAILAAITDGLRRRLDPGEPQSGNTDDPAVAAEELRRRPGAALPRTLGEALQALGESTVISGALGPELHGLFHDAKTDEWERACGAVTEWHREMYLRALP